MSAPTEGDRAFLAILPAVLRYAEFAFRRIKCEQTYQDKVQETLCFCWLWSRRLVEEKGKDPRQFPTTLAVYAVRHVRSGRRFCGGKLGLKDACNPVAHAIHGFIAKSLPQHQSTANAAPWMEQLVDQPSSRVAQLAAFRIDFPVWLDRLSDRNRELAEEMAQGETTLELSQRFRVSPGRVSQLRRQFLEDWRSFVGGS